MKQLPDEGFLPIRPRFGACALAVRQSQQHKRVQVFLVLHNVGQLHHCGWVIQVSLLRDPGEGEMMIDEQDKRLALLGGQLQTGRDALGKERACFRVRPGANGFAAVVQKKREIEDQRVLEFLKDSAISNQLGITRFR